ncbi:MAG: hypothetical protein NXI24_07135 [bacterium]|nr:hypothetical protein [bacterium]
MLLGLALATTTCASTSLDHMAVTNYADRTIVPDHRGAQWALTPVLIPLTVVTLAVDNLIVAPAVQLPSAGTEARSFYEVEVEGYYSHLAITPFQVALTPVVFAGAWIARSFFAIETHADAAWSWPEWGRQWQRDADGRLIGPPPAKTDAEKSPDLSEPAMEKPAEAAP